MVVHATSRRLVVTVAAAGLLVVACVVLPVLYYVFAAKLRLIR